MLRSVLAVVVIPPVMVTAVVMVATLDATLKATEAVRKAPEHTGARPIAMPVANQAIGPRTAELTLLQMPQPRPPLPCRNQSHREKRSHSSTFLSGARPHLIK